MKSENSTAVNCIEIVSYNKFFKVKAPFFIKLQNPKLLKNSGIDFLPKIL